MRLLYRKSTAINVYLFNDYPQTLVNSQKALAIAIAEQRNLPRKAIYAAMSNVIIGHDKLGQNELLIQAALHAIRYQARRNIAQSGANRRESQNGQYR